MAVSKPKLIKNYLAGVLAAIDGTGSYVNTVCAVNEKTGNKIADVSKGAAEVWLQIGVISNIPGTHGKRLRRVAYKITGQIVNPMDAADSDGAMLSLFADLVRAVELDATCGGIATGLKWSEMSPVVGEPAVECVLSVTAEYQEDRT